MRKIITILVLIMIMVTGCKENEPIKSGWRTINISHIGEIQIKEQWNVEETEQYTLIKNKDKTIYIITENNNKSLERYLNIDGLEVSYIHDKKGDENPKNYISKISSDKYSGIYKVNINGIEQLSYVGIFKVDGNVYEIVCIDHSDEQLVDIEYIISNI